ncbi:MAG: tetratricopeptide repeat protein [Verrucomicrobiota bacterium]
MNHRTKILSLLVGSALMFAGAKGFAQAPKPPATSVPPVIVDGPAEAFKKAQTVYQSGDLVAALVAFQAFEKKFPFSLALPDAIYYQGWCLASQARHQEAVNVFQRLITGYVNNALVAEAILKQAECCRELKDDKRAIELYRTFQARYPKHELLSQAVLGEAWANFKAGNLPAAKVIINAARQRFADNPAAALDAWFLLGQIYTEDKDYAAADKVYRLITKQPPNPRTTEALYLAAEAMFNRGEALFKDGKTDEGRQAYRDAITYYNGVRTKLELVDLVQKNVDKLRANQGRIVAESGLEAWQSQFDAVKRSLAQVKERPDLRVLALFRVANCYQALYMPEEASVIYAFLRDRYPAAKAAEQIYFGLVQTLQSRGQKEQADAEADAFKKKYPNSGVGNNIALVQAEAQFADHKYKEALDNYEKARAASKDAATVETIEFRMATAHFNLEDFETARTAFASFAQKHPDSKIRPDALFFLGLTHYQVANRSTDPKIAQPNIASAIEAYEEIRTKHVQYDKLPMVTFRLGYLYSFAGAYDRDADGKLTTTANFDKAIAIFQEFLQKWPDYKDPEGKLLAPEALYQIGQNHLSAGRYPDAITAYKALIDKFPDHDLAPYAAKEIGENYYLLKKPAEMIEALRFYVLKYPSHSKAGDALYVIASELENQKRYDESIMAYRDIINRALAASTLTDEARNAAISAQLHISSLLERNEPKTVVADCETFLGKFAGDTVAARTMISQIASIYRKARLIPDAYAKLEQLSQQYQLNTTIRHACVISLIELAIGEKDYTRANGAVARMLADPERDKLPASGFLAIGNVSLKTEKFAQARENYERVLIAAGNDQKFATLANLGIGQALIGLQQFTAAQVPLEKALADTHNCPRAEAQLALAKTLEATGKTEKAVELYSIVMSGRGDVTFEAAYRLGNIFYNMVSDPAKVKENKKLALAYYARLLFATGPMAEEGAYRSAECHAALGVMERACPAFHSYIKRFPAGRFVDEAKANIAKLCAPKPE